MNRVTSCVPAALVLSAWSVAALAADPPATPTATTTAAAPAATTATTPAKPAATTSTTASASSTSDGAVRRLVCLNMSLQCFAMKPNPSDAAAKTRTASLDLKAPEIHRVVSEAQLTMATEEPTEIEEQQVQIEGSRPEVYVPGGIASLPWAVMHPTQAWRILMPVPPGTAK